MICIALTYTNLYINCIFFLLFIAQFTDFYYSTFDSDRSSLSGLYRNESMLTWEGSPIQGVSSIIEKLTSLPFQKVEHKVSSLDAQPGSPNGDIIVLITGLLVVDDSEQPLQFSQVFHLIPDNGSYYVFNDVFRLVYGS